jgi:hypothetical protein
MMGGARRARRKAVLRSRTAGLVLSPLTGLALYVAVLFGVHLSSF